MNEVEVKHTIPKIVRFCGFDNQISRRALLEELGLAPTTTNDRKLRELIRELRRGDELNPPFPILPGKDGYYYPQTETEKQEGIEKYSSYVKDACITLNALKHAEIVTPTNEQLRMI